MNKFNDWSVIRPGAEVTIWGGVKGRVYEVIIELTQVSYKVLYWDNGAAVYGVFPQWAIELVPNGQVEYTIGFKT